MSHLTQTEKSRTTAKEFIRALGERRMEDLGGLFGPGAHWSVVARTDRSTWGGSNPGAHVAKVAKEFVDEFESWDVQIVNLVAEDDKAFVEGLVKGRGPGQKAYTNTYLMRFIVGDDGKIKDFKEGMDSYEVEAAIASVEEYKKQHSKG